MLGDNNPPSQEGLTLANLIRKPLLAMEKVFAKQASGVEIPLMSDADASGGPEQEVLPTSTRTKSASPGHPTAFLDGLRGLAAFLVYNVHHISWFYGSTDDIHHGFLYHGEKYFSTFPFVRLFFTGGSAAVAIFFVLSGYVLSRSPLNLLVHNEFSKLYSNLLSAVVRRPFRLFIPPAGVSLAVALIMQLPFGLAPRFTWPQAKENFFAELANWFVELCWALNPMKKHGIFEPWFPYDPPVWTMPVEFEGSILVFSLVAVSSLVPRRYRVPSLVLLGLGLLFTYQWAMACFVAGMVLALGDVERSTGVKGTRRLSRDSRMARCHLSFFFGWWLLCETAGTHEPEMSLYSFGWYWLTMLIPGNYYFQDYWRFWHTVGAVLLVYGVLRLQWLQRFLTTRPLRYLGRISFSLYLTHIPFLWIMGDRVYRLFGAIKADSNMETWFDNKLTIPEVGPHGLSLRYVMSQLVILSLNMLLAHVCAIMLDEPSVKISRWVVSRRWGQQKS